MGTHEDDVVAIHPQQLLPQSHEAEDGDEYGGEDNGEDGEALHHDMVVGGCIVIIIIITITITNVIITITMIT